MGGDAIADAWLEIFSATAAGETTVRWYVEYCTAYSRSIVADRRTQDEAISAAQEWDLPIAHSSSPTGVGADQLARDGQRSCKSSITKIWS